MCHLIYRCNGIGVVELPLLDSFCEFWVNLARGKGGTSFLGTYEQTPAPRLRYPLDSIVIAERSGSGHILATYPIPTIGVGDEELVLNRTTDHQYGVIDGLRRMLKGSPAFDSAEAHFSSHITGTAFSAIVASNINEHRSAIIDDVLIELTQKTSRLGSSEHSPVKCQRFGGEFVSVNHFKILKPSDSRINKDQSSGNNLRPKIEFFASLFALPIGFFLFAWSWKRIYYDPYRNG